MRIELPADRQLSRARYKPGWNPPWNHEPEFNQQCSTCQMFASFVVVSVRACVSPCRLHCCWQLKHLLRGYEHIVRQVCFRWCFLFLAVLFCHLPRPRFCCGCACTRHSCTLSAHQARPTHLAERRKNKYIYSLCCLINMAGKMSLFVMWPLRVIWMRLIFHPGLQSSLFSQPLSYH